MIKKISLTLLSALLLVFGVKPVVAETVLESVAKTGRLVVGTSFDRVPYAYYNQQEELDGYSIDIVKLIQKQLEQELGKTIEIDFVEANSITEVLPKLTSGEIDVACNTVFTWERDRHADFTIRYSLSGIRLLVPAGNTSDSVANKKIGVPPATFVQDAMKLAYPQATLVTMSTLAEGVAAFKAGQVDALAGDSLILDGVRQEIAPDDYEIFPKLTEKPYARYGVACMVRENNSGFLNIANYAIAKMMEGYLVGDQQSLEMLNKWFGPEGVIEIIDPELVKEFYQNTITNHEQIPFDN
ncbi:periplasmic component of amino acid ABC-type transporter/signal transduction system [Xenococcus sp. PCC 7305]|uniref:extracellular substrate binding-like orphan protein GrrP n=1 Tax=Xenococcus sp. PCC 7305 TaxID=102125 RepID=UPI0002ABB785|nr:extracellular substrate binding-like orphan protein GrrP [Xenococcus sp. PCC 7305]ELS01944.1 periplasmic component of amino acid ABC-type transporter/signal transduction system [Xenococcus sp. PCC 7305]